MLTKFVCTTLLMVSINTFTACHNSNRIETFKDTSFYDDEYFPFICEFDTVGISMMQSIKSDIKDTVITPEQADKIRKYMQHMRKESNDTTVSFCDIKNLYQKINPFKRIYATLQTIKFANENGDTQVIKHLIIK